MKFYHCIVDGTWGTIKGSCTVVCDFADLCYQSYTIYLKEPASNEVQTLRFIHAPACIVVGVLGLIVEIPLYTAIAVVKGPYMLFRGWHRLLQDLITQEGPFLETACIPVAGLAILMWPLVVIGSILMAIFTSFFISIYGSVVVFQERSFKRGVAYVIAMVAEFDEYTNDLLYLRKGTILPKPRYRKQKPCSSSDLSVKRNQSLRGLGMILSEAPGMLVPSSLMKSFEAQGKELLDAGLITPADLYDWLKAKHANDATIIGVGLPCFCYLHVLLKSIKTGSSGLVHMDATEINHLNRPQDRLLDWFFQPVMVLKEQI